MMHFGGNMRFDKRRQTIRGFTIVELLIVVVVVAILAAITVVAYNGIREKAESSALKSELSQLQKKIQTDVLQDTGVTISIKPPLIYAKKEGSTTLASPLVAAQELTLYGVFDSLNNPSVVNWSQIIALYPADTNNSIRLRSGAASDNTARGFHATSVQPNRDLTKNNILNNTSRHIGWISANASMIYSSFDNLPDGSASLAAHAGWNFNSINLVSSAAYTSIAALVFPEYHDETTRAQIVRWLSRAYNVGL